jgi:hypothetical protein
MMAEIMIDKTRGEQFITLHCIYCERSFVGLTQLIKEMPSATKAGGIKVPCTAVGGNERGKRGDEGSGTNSMTY